MIPAPDLRSTHGLPLPGPCQAKGAELTLHHGRVCYWLSRFGPEYATGWPEMYLFPLFGASLVRQRQSVDEHVSAATPDRHPEGDCNNNSNDDFISTALFHVKHAQLR